MINRAMILAAGLGKRMRPLTETIPKPLIPVAGKPLIDWCLDFLAAGSISDVVINSSYRAKQLEAHVAPRSNVVISQEGEPPLETGGGVYKALPLLGKFPFLTMNSDAIFIGDNPIQSMRRVWDETMDFLMLMIPRAKAIGWQGNGDFILDAKGRIRRPKKGEVADYIFTGVQIMRPQVFDGHPRIAFSLSKLWQEREGADGWHARMQAMVFDGDWLNVGDLAGLKAAEAFLASR